MNGSISENLAVVLDRIHMAARRAGRDPREITLVAATKGVDTRKIRQAVKAGLRTFGENYVQEAKEKIEKIKSKNIKWHLIGNLQKNKVKLAVELFDMIETVDSIELARLIDKRARRPMDVLIEVNIAREKTKKGVDLRGVLKLATQMAALEKVNLRGLMAIPPFHEDPEMSRPYFITLRRLAERINREHIPGVFLRDLSMGMSADFDVAIEEGATIVRIGTAIFGPRKPAKKKS